METSHDSIKYVLPIYGNSQTGDDLSARFDKDFDVTDAYHNVMYESTESRYVTELVNADEIEAAAPTVTVAFEGNAFGTMGQAYINGNSMFFVIGMDGTRKPLAMQDARGTWFIGTEVPVGEDANGDMVSLKASAFTVSTTAEGAYQVAFTIQSKTGEGDFADATDLADYQFAAIGRYDSERDLIGQYLGEAELTMRDYHFKPRPVMLGVTWTTMTELVLDTSFGISAEETLLDAAAQEIKKSLDYNAVKYADSQQRLRAPQNFVQFDAGAGDTTDDSYKLTAQLITNAINRIADKQLNMIGRGGVSAIVGGPAAVNYLTLSDMFEARGAQPQVGGHKVGELAGELIRNASVKIA